MLTNIRSLGLLLAMVACVVDVTPPGGARITCDESVACPAGLACDLEIGRCLPTDAQGELPSLVDSQVSPGRLAPGHRLTVEVASSLPLAAAPRLEARAGAVARPLALSAELESQRWRFEYVVGGDEPEGGLSIVADLIADNGRRADDLPVGTVVVDASPPELISVGVEGALEHDGRTWVDTVVVSLLPALAVDGEVPTTLRITGDVATEVSGPYTEMISVELSAGDGSKVLTLEVADDLDNRATITLNLELETSTPTAAIVIDTPSEPEVWLNADSFTLLFHSTDTLSFDFAGYVVSTDGGATFAPIPVAGVVSLPGLAQNAITEVRIAESDIFGNRTEPAAYGALRIHEDSVAPGAVAALTPQLVGSSNGERGVFVYGRDAVLEADASFEVLGGANTEFVDVGASPFVRLSGIAPGRSTPFVLRARDRAGNRGESATVLIADERFAATPVQCNGACVRGAWAAGGQTVVYYDVLQNSGGNTHLVGGCGSDTCGISVLDCGGTCDPSNTRVRYLTVVGGVLVAETDFDGGASEYLAWYLGSDGAPGGDDGSTSEIAQGRCLGGGGANDRTFVYGREPLVSGQRRLYLYDFGANVVPGGDDTATEVTVSNVMASGGCALGFDGRHIVWPENTGARYFDLGADRRPGGGDDSGPVNIVDPDTAANVPFHKVKVGPEALVIEYGALRRRLLRPGSDGTFFTLDDLTTDLGTLATLEVKGDKLIVDSGGGQLDLFDLSSGRLIQGTNPASGAGRAVFFSLRGAVPMGAVESLGGPPLPARYQVGGDPTGFHFADATALGIPSGWFAGELYFASQTGHLVNWQRPSVRDLGSVVSATSRSAGIGSAEAIDLADGLLVWAELLGSAVQIWALSVGVDGLPGSTDDLGATLVAQGSGLYGPRTDGRRVVWGVGNWRNSGGNRTLAGVDLGADGFVGGGDDTSLDLSSAGTDAVHPDVSGPRVAFLDYSVDPDQQCPGSDPTNCLPAIRLLELGPPSSLSTLAPSGPHQQMRLDEDFVVWSELGVDWDVMAYDLVRDVTIDKADAYDQTHPTIVGGRLAYFDRGPLLVDVGSNGVLDSGPGDDVTLAISCALGFTCWGSVDDLLPPSSLSTYLLEGRRPAWLGDSFVALGGAFLPLASGAQTFGRQNVDRPIPDQGVLVDTLSIAVDPGDFFGDVSIAFDIEHADSSQVRVSLTSPEGDEVELFVGKSVTPMTAGSAGILGHPPLFDFYGEALAGDWQLIVEDLDAGTTGVLHSWSLERVR